MSFKHELGQVVTVSISEEEGHIKARAEYTHGPNQYLIHYRAADGRAVDAWFEEGSCLHLHSRRTHYRSPSHCEGLDNANEYHF